MTSDFHPDFLAADEAHRWTKPLHGLMEALRTSAWKARGAWVYWILPAGACVAMRITPPEPGGGRTSSTAGGQSFRKELRISRRGIKKRDDALWHAEVGVFKRHLEVENWEKGVLVVEPEADTTDGTYRAVATLLEPPRPAAAAAPENVCSRCGKPTPHEPQYKADLCTECAVKAGREEVAAKQGMLDLPPYPGGGETERPGGEPT